MEDGQGRGTEGGGVRRWLVNMEGVGKLLMLDMGTQRGVSTGKASTGLTPELWHSGLFLNVLALSVTSRQIGKVLTHCRGPLHCPGAAHLLP